MAQSRLNLNERALAVADELAARERELSVSSLFVNGVRVIDVGVAQNGSIGAGVLTARACLADLADVSVVPGRVGAVPIPYIAVNVHLPVAACMASQYAGWQIKVGDYFAMGSGPIRAAVAGVAGEGAGEKLFDHIGFRQCPLVAVGVLETSAVPTPQALEYIREKSGVKSGLTLIIARTASIAGGVQIVARSVETALHKLHELGFDLSRVIGGFGSAPLPPVAKNDMKAIGRTNDAILYGGEVTLTVRGDDESLVALGARLPSNTSRDYGRPFADTFKVYNYDFYKVDPMLFSPASICLQNLDTGKSHHFGAVNHEILATSFFG